MIVDVLGLIAVFQSAKSRVFDFHLKKELNDDTMNLKFQSAKSRVFDFHTAEGVNLVGHPEFQSAKSRVFDFHATPVTSRLDLGVSIR